MKKESLHRIFSKMPMLRTGRLYLRPMRVTDAEDMFAYAKNPEVSRYLVWRAHADIGYTREYLTYLEGRYRQGLHYEWAVICGADNRMIGTCGFSAVDTVHGVGEVGYVLHPDYWGQGFATEALREVLRFGFHVLGLRRIEARYAVGNEASRRVMEKVGMCFEGVRRQAMLLKGAPVDIGMCAILRHEFNLE